MASRFLTLVLEKSAEVAEHRAAFEDAHGRASSAKKRYEGSRDELDAMLDKHREELGPDRLPFPKDEDDSDDDDSGGGGGGDDDPKPGPKSPQDDHGISPEVADLFRRSEAPATVIDVEFRPAQGALPSPAARTVIQSPLDSNAWRDQVIADLPGLSFGTASKLADQGIKTVGSIADWSNAGKRLTDLDSIGDAKAGEIEEALDSFWIEWHRKQAAKPESVKSSRKRKSKDDEAA
jgi:hypothetical protein